MDSADTTNLALLVEYDGAGFCGFQKQAFGVRTIQAELENALSRFADSKIEIITSGRTDTGVHATHQVINFTTTAERELYSWVRGINALLPKDIVVKNAAAVTPDFNARFAAISRTYHYYLRVDPVRSALLRGKVGWYHAPLNINKIQRAGQYLIGNQDFTSFRAANCQANTPVRNLANFTISQKNDLLRFEFTANAFLYHMVRNMVGALVYVGNGKLSVDGFRDLIAAANRSIAPPTFMPDGLYLVQVTYPQLLFPDANPNWLF